jgi:DNA-directed RNA polymerase specialized sigma24 family protein
VDADVDLLGAVLPLPRHDRDAAITALFRREHARLVGFARLLVDDQQTAEDVVQEAFNGARSQLRRRRTVRAFRAPRAHDEPSAENVVARRDEHRQALAGLARLPRRQQEALVLR